MKTTMNNDKSKNFYLKIKVTKNIEIKAQNFLKIKKKIEKIARSIRN